MNTPNPNPNPNPTPAPVTPEGLTLVPEHVQGAGLLVWWSLSGSASFERLEQAWEAEGLHEEDCPAPPSPMLALRLAVDEQARGKLRRVAFEGGHALVRDTVVTDDQGQTMPGTEPVVKLKLDETGDAPVLQFHGDLAMAQLIQQRWRELRTEWPSSAVTTWLPKYIKSRCDGTCLKDNGGNYYVPPAHVETMQKVKRAIKAASDHRLTTIEALRSEDAVEAILYSLVEETTTAVERALEDVDTPRIKRNRQKRLEELTAKVVRYEQILDVKAADLHQTLEEAEGTLALMVFDDHEEDDD